MKVLFVTHYADLYGANLSLLGLMISLKKNYSIEPIVLINRKGEFIKELERNNIKYIRTFYFIDQIEENQPHKRCHVLYRKLFMPFLYFYAFFKIRKEKIIFDLIHTNSSVVSIGEYLARKFSVPHIWHLREFGREDYSLENMYSVNTIKKRLSNSKIIAISDSIKEKFVSEYGELSIEVIANGISICERYTKDEPNGLISFVVIGLICEGKNQLEVLKAIKIIVSKEIKNFCVYFYGDFKDEEYKFKFLNFVKDNELDKFVHIMGYVENVKEQLKSDCIGIVPSKKEAFGRVTIEFMSNYMPVIGSNSGGNKEIIIDKKTGLLYDLGAECCLAQKMIYYLENRNEIIRMGKNARIEAEKYSVDENAKKIKEVYDLVLEKGR